jgi:hypothetical protein
MLYSRKRFALPPSLLVYFAKVIKSLQSSKYYSPALFPDSDSPRLSRGAKLLTIKNLYNYGNKS